MTGEPRSRPWKSLGPIPTPGWVWLGLGLGLGWLLLGVTVSLGWHWGWAIVLLGMLAWQRERLTVLAPLELRLIEGLSLVAFWVVVSLSWLPIGSVLGPVLGRLASLAGITGDAVPNSWSLLLLAIGLVLASPWLWDGLLRWIWKAEPLELERLRETSPEVIGLFRRGLGATATTMPRLWLVPSPAPIALSYGLGRWTRLVLSQGTFDRLSPRELTAIVAGQVGQVQQRSVVLPLLNLLLLLPYGFYWQLASWGDHWQAQSQRGGDAGLQGLRSLLRWICGIGAAIGYGLFKLWRWPLLLLSRSRLHWADRAAAELSGDPNAYAQGLINLAQGQVKAIRRAQRLPGLLEGLELLLPIGPYSAISLSQMPPLQAVKADANHLYLAPLTLNQAQAPLGQRLRWLNDYGARSGRKPDVALPAEDPTQFLNPWRLRSLPQSQRRLATLAWLKRCQPLLLQCAPLAAPILGAIGVLLLWWIASLASLLGLAAFDPIFGDDQVLRGTLVLSLGLGLLLRTNRFFKPRSPQQMGNYESALEDLLDDPQATPLRSRSIDLQGKLIGRSGVANWLGQDLILDTGNRLIRLHWCSPLGPLGNLWPGFLRPSLLVGRSVTVTGWLRRGATLWIDVEQIRTDRGKTSQRGHPMWAAVMAGVIVAIGIGILLGLL
jgi:Zn-dependent protease with chaperone function